jgi:hypothetical protein
MFFVCRPCDRGHRYCRIECRSQARLEQRREANRRNQRTPEGRDNHRRLQADYRMRLRSSGVTDQGSEGSKGSETLAPEGASGNESAPWRRFEKLVCIVCKVLSRLVDPFDKVRWRR